MKKLILILSVGLILAACGGVAKLEVSEINSVFIEYNPADNINFGSEIDARILARLSSGKEVDITNNRKLAFVSTDIQQRGNSKRVVLIKHPNSFSDEYATAKFTLTDKDETYQASDSIHINFRGNLNILAGGLHGNSGEDQKSRGSTIVFRDGKDGENGTFGQAGSSSSNFVAQIWMEELMVFIYMRNTATNEEWKYKTLAEGPIKFDLTGGNGGSGGDGGNGGDGKAGVIEGGKSKNPGDGGHGGHGGDGGNGGNGGTIQIFLHPNATSIQTKLDIKTLGGNGGVGGKSGTAGKPGAVLAGQLTGNMGRNGRVGRRGLNGGNGSFELTVLEFDVEQFK